MCCISPAFQVTSLDGAMLTAQALSLSLNRGFADRLHWHVQRCSSDSPARALLDTLMGLCERASLLVTLSAYVC